MPANPNTGKAWHSGARHQLGMGINHPSGVTSAA